MTRIFLVGDTHFAHRNITKYREGYDTREEHDQQIHEKVMSVANRRNILWLMGDNFFEPETYRYLEDYSKHFMEVNWILGNHDTDINHRVEFIKRAIKDDLVHKIGSLFKYGGFWLSHHPIHPEELRGKINIHGHVHNATIRDRRYMNVSVDNLIDHKPASFQLLKIGKPELCLKEYGE